MESLNAVELRELQRRGGSASGGRCAAGGFENVSYQQDEESDEPGPAATRVCPPRTSTVTGFVFRAATINRDQSVIEIIVQ